MCACMHVCACMFVRACIVCVHLCVCLKPHYKDCKCQNNVCGSEHPIHLHVCLHSLSHTHQVWDRTTHNCMTVLQGHTGSVLCLQYDDRVIITGSSDSTIRFVGGGGKERGKEREREGGGREGGRKDVKEGAYTCSRASK